MSYMSVVIIQIIYLCVWIIQNTFMVVYYIGKRIFLLTSFGVVLGLGSWCYVSMHNQRNIALINNFKNITADGLRRLTDRLMPCIISSSFFLL